MTKTRTLIALFGGSFNPPTRRHREIGLLLLEQAPVAQVWFLVAPLNPFKSATGMAPFADRVAMTRLNLTGQPRLRVCEDEARFAARLGVGALNSADTLSLMRGAYPDHRFVWVVGADNFTTMHTWDGYGDILRHHPVVVVPRAGIEGAQITQCPTAQELTQLRDPKKLTTARGWYVLSAELSELCATSCRAALQVGARPAGLRPAVATYALAKNLYDPSPLAA